MLATDSSSRAVAGTGDGSGRKERSQPALRIPGPEPRLESHAPPRSVAALAALVGEVIAGLDRAPVDEPLRSVVARCNAALESCLENQRAHEVPVTTARDELKRLVRQLGAADAAELTGVMRQIRCVLGRLDARHGD